MRVGYLVCSVVHQSECERARKYATTRGSGANRPANHAEAVDAALSGGTATCRRASGQLSAPTVYRPLQPRDVRLARRVMYRQRESSGGGNPVKSTATECS